MNLFAALQHILIVASVVPFAVSLECETVESMDQIDLGMFRSKAWFSHQQRPEPFNPVETFYCVKAEYSLLDASNSPSEAVSIENNFTVKVFNSAEDADGNVITSDDPFLFTGQPSPGPLCAATGYGNKDSQLKVGFCTLPASIMGVGTNYWVLAYDEDEGMALIAAGQTDLPTGNDGLCSYNSPFFSLWILSRSPVRNEALIEKYRGIAIDNGIDPSIMSDVSHVNCDHTTKSSKKSKKSKKTKAPKSP